MQRIFNIISSRPDHFLYLVPKKYSSQAESFEKEYGGLFNVKAVGTVDGFPACILQNANNVGFVVEKREDGIYIDEKFYAKKW